MVQFCRENGLKHDVCGKVIIACDQAELPLLESLPARAPERPGEYHSADCRTGS